MRVKPRLRGTVIAAVSLLVILWIFYVGDRNSPAAKPWLWVFFATGVFGGALAVVDSLRSFLKARKENAGNEE